MEEKIVIKCFDDVPSASVSIQSTLCNKTGDWRTMRPVHVDLESPCTNACPIAQEIPLYLTSLAKGRPQDAWERMLQVNPFPSVCGRVCHHPCEQACHRGSYDESVSIHALERYLGDWGLDNGRLKDEEIKRREEKVAVVGAGPAGLSCAYFMARMGYGVSVFESMHEPGGMLRYGIPEYRLPRAILDKEIERIVSLGVEIQTGKRFGVDVMMEDMAPYQAVFFASGAHKERKQTISGEDLKGVWHGVTFLKQVNSGLPTELGKKVIVIGGGNTALDSARVALRKGSAVTVVYRRVRDEMPAIPAEITAAIEEGVEFIYNAVPTKITGQGEYFNRMECLRTKSGKIDQSGRMIPMPIDGSEFFLDADSLILAIGEEADLSFLPEKLETEHGTIAADTWGRTNLKAVFAGGDAATAAGYVSNAISSGKKTALAIDAHLRGEDFNPVDAQTDGVKFENLNLNYFEKMPKIKPSTLEIDDRVSGFKEVHSGISKAEAKTEAERCFSCGHCVNCNVCLMVCPEVAISYDKVTHTYNVNYDYCKGCGICAEECPRSEITLEEEKWSM